MTVIAVDAWPTFRGKRLTDAPIVIEVDPADAGSYDGSIKDAAYDYVHQDYGYLFNFDIEVPE